MSKGNELKFKVGAATNTEREQRNEGGKNRDHAPQRYGGGAQISRPSQPFGVLSMDSRVCGIDHATDVEVRNFGRRLIRSRSCSGLVPGDPSSPIELGCRA